MPTLGLTATRPTAQSFHGYAELNISVHILLMPPPIQWHSTWILHSRAKCRPIMKGVPILTKKLTPSAKTGLWRATGGLHSEDSTKTTSGHFHMLHQKHHLACPAVHTNLCNKSTPMHNKHGQPKHPVSMHATLLAAFAALVPHARQNKQQQNVQ